MLSYGRSTVIAFATALVLLHFSQAASATPAKPPCSAAAQYGTGCISADQSAISIEASRTISDTGASSAGGTSVGGGSSDSTGTRDPGTGGGPAAPPPPPAAYERALPIAQGASCPTLATRFCSEEALGGYVPPAEPAEPAEPPPGQPAITITDLVTFRPQTAALASEPSSVAVVGLPFNPYATIGQHVVAGSLLGQPAEVRFTPYAYQWDYGDGATSRTGTGGASWAQLGAREFDATPTSHVYSDRGSYTLTLTVEYTAEYRYAGSPWIPVTGVLTLPAPPLTIIATGATTVLVSGDCRQQPTGPGC